MRSRTRVVLGATLAAAVAVAAGPGVAGAAVPSAGLTFAPSTHSWFAYGTVNVGSSATQVFTLTQNGVGSSNKLSIGLRGSRAFAITADTCTGASLQRGQTCQVTVGYTPRTAGRGDRALLTVSTQRWFWWHGWHVWNRPSRPLFLTGQGAGPSSGSGGGLGSSGPAALTLAPGTATSAGVWSYDYGQSRTAGTVFTVTNTGGTATLPLTLAGFSDGGGFTISNDLCSGVALGAGQSCTFTESWSANSDPICDGIGTPDSIVATVTDANQAYIEADLSAVCG